MGRDSLLVSVLRCHAGIMPCELSFILQRQHRSTQKTHYSTPCNLHPKPAAAMIFQFCPTPSYACGSMKARSRRCQPVIDLLRRSLFQQRHSWCKVRAWKQDRRYTYIRNLSSCRLDPTQIFNVVAHGRIQRLRSANVIAAKRRTSVLYRQEADVLAPAGWS